MDNINITKLNDIQFDIQCDKHFIKSNNNEINNDTYELLYYYFYLNYSNYNCFINVSELENDMIFRLIMDNDLQIKVSKYLAFVIYTTMITNIDYMNNVNQFNNILKQEIINKLENYNNKINIYDDIQTWSCCGLFCLSSIQASITCLNKLCYHLFG